jgi:hypothetical protein
MRGKYDPSNLMAKGKVYNCNWFKWFLICLIKPRKYDIIHVHSYDKIIPFLKLLYPGKKIIIHYHGTLIRGNWSKHRLLFKLADKIIVSTPDLLEGAPQGVEYLPNPIDYDLIDNISPNVKIPKIFHAVRYAEDVAKEYAAKLDKELIIFDRDSERMAHKEFLTELTKYAYYIDVKRGHNRPQILEALSLTGLEASYGGAILINWKGDIIPEFPDHHKKDQVCNALYQIYRDVLLK